MVWSGQAVSAPSSDKLRQMSWFALEKKETNNFNVKKPHHLNLIHP